MNQIHVGDDAAAARRLDPLPPLHALRTFHAAARIGRFRDAAVALGLSESAVSHQIRKLEDYLGLKLFDRQGQRVVLTAAGRSYFATVGPAFDSLREATAALRTPGGRRRVGLTVPTSLAIYWLIPKLGRLEADCPGVSLQLTTTSRLCDLEREQIDLAIRYGSGRGDGLDAEFFMPEFIFPVCRPGFWERDPSEGLAGARVLVNELHPEEWNEWTAAHGLAPPDLRGSMVLSSSEQLQVAAEQGLGLAMGRRPLVDQALAEGRLVAPFGTAVAAGEAAYYLVWPRATGLTAAARQIARWLRGLVAPAR